MHTGPRGPLLFGWCTHYVPTTSHQPLATFRTAPHLCTHSEPGCTATFGCACPSMFPIAQRTFHHKPALVAPIILWLEYFLCAHHTNFPNFQLPGTCADPLFCLPGPSWLAHHLAHPSAHLRTPPCTSAHLCAPLCISMHLCAPLCNFLHFTFQG